ASSAAKKLSGIPRQRTLGLHIDTALCTLEHFVRQPEAAGGPPAAFASLSCFCCGPVSLQSPCRLPVVSLPPPCGFSAASLWFLCRLPVVSLPSPRGFSAVPLPTPRRIPSDSPGPPVFIRPRDGELAGRRRGDGGEMAGRWRGDGGETAGRWRGDGGETMGSRHDYVKGMMAVWADLRSDALRAYVSSIGCTIQTFGSGRRPWSRSTSISRGTGAPGGR
ncbi:MAG: hypothetical protein K0R39_2210, partial [Symbiobacteriaceae bacterium]|nr:hypothetical protein [Symbiobacteriaceae bacterium]